MVLSLFVDLFIIHLELGIETFISIKGKEPPKTYILVFYNLWKA
jgi:hypothetical protein